MVSPPIFYVSRTILGTRKAGEGLGAAGDGDPLSVFVREKS